MPNICESLKRINSFRSHYPRSPLYFRASIPKTRRECTKPWMVLNLLHIMFYVFSFTYSSSIYKSSTVRRI